MITCQITIDVCYTQSDLLSKLTDNDQAMIKKSDSANFTPPFYFDNKSKAV